jgi:peptidoglycan/xylan/chitin deacetylase (PgdA/CDA1 family)
LAIDLSVILATLLLVNALGAAGGGNEVAITIDDLPRGGDTPDHCNAASVNSLTRQLLAPFATGHVPLIGFVNEGRCPAWKAGELQSILELWLEAGADLGNHTFSHPNLNDTLLKEYEKDVLKGEITTGELLRKNGRALRYFRHPYLHAGTSLRTKDALEAFLKHHGYRIAPVTLDNSDYVFARVYANALQKGDTQLADRVKRAYLPYLESIFEFFERRAVEVTGHAIPQILLIHVNALNAEMMPQMLDMMKRRGYKFVNLDRALSDPAYALPDRYAGPKGFSWIHRWSFTKGMPPKEEPAEPAFITAEYKKLE